MDDAVFARARAQFTPEELVELVATAAWENAVSRFGHAFGVESLGLWRPGAQPTTPDEGA